MALSRLSCEKAIIIFEELCYLKSSIILERNETNQFEDGYVFGIDKKEDGGWESLFVNIKGITQHQEAIWNEFKKGIPNSHSLHEVKPGITRLGFY